MRQFKVLLIITLGVLFILVANAQSYKAQFKVDDTGKVSNEKGTRLGTIESDGTIKDANGKVVGKLIKSDNGSELMNHLGKKMGELLDDGTLKDAKGKTMFTISTADEAGICKILDKNGKPVGTVHENYKNQGACAYHCLANKDHKHK
jgi:hypothetical protein